MAKTIGVLGGGAVLPRQNNQVQAGSFISILARKIAAYMDQQRDRDIERFIEQRGGVITDDVERELSIRFGRM